MSDTPLPEPENLPLIVPDTSIPVDAANFTPINSEETFLRRLSRPSNISATVYVRGFQAKVVRISCGTF
jgi:hypothetical protein